MLATAARSTMSPVMDWFRFSRRRTTFVGIDIGIDGVNVATFGYAGDPMESPALSWTSHWGFSLPVDPMAAPPSNWVDLVVDHLADRLPRTIEGDRDVCVISLPLPWVHYQVSSESERDLARQQCNAMFNASLFHCPAHLTYWPAALGGDKWMVAAIAEQAASRIADTVSSLGYRVEAILPHGAALLHAAPQLTSLRPAAVVALELAGGLVAVAEQSSCGLARHLPPCQLPTGRQPYLEELEPWLQEVASEVNATFRYASRLGGAADPKGLVLLSGAVAEIAGVDSVLASMLGRPVAGWRYVGRIRPHLESRADSMPVTDAGVALALSLAFAAVDLDDSRRRRSSQA